MSTWDDKPNDYEHALIVIERQREVIKTCLTVLCASQNGQSWSMPMNQDFNIAIGGCRSVLKTD